MVGAANAPSCLPLSRGFVAPWLVFFDGHAWRGLVGLTPDGLVNVDAVVSPSVASLFEAAYADPSVALIGAHEAPVWADRSGTRLRGVSVDMSTGATPQTVVATAEGKLVVRENGEVNPPGGRSAVFPSPGTSNRMLVLSGALGEFYQLA